MNIDELKKQIEQDEREDQRLITPIEYGRLRGIAPQRVYAKIRDHKLEPVQCECGRRCVVKEEADELFGFGRPDEAEELETVDGEAAGRVPPEDA